MGIKISMNKTEIVLIVIILKLFKIHLYYSRKSLNLTKKAQKKSSSYLDDFLVKLKHQ